MNKKKHGIMLTGGSSLLVIFAVLCLTVFALLTLSTVKADLRLADASVQAVEAYYRADCEAEELLALLREGKLPEGVKKEGTRYTYTCPVSETQSLHVVVDVQGTDYRIEQWKLITTEEWSPKKYIELRNPEMEE